MSNKQKLKWFLRRIRQKLATWSIKKLMHQSGESSQMPACFGYTCYILPKHYLVNLDTKATIEKTYISLKERVRSKHVPERKWGRIRDQPYSLLRHAEKRRKWSPPVIPPSVWKHYTTPLTTCHVTFSEKVIIFSIFWPGGYGKVIPHRLKSVRKV